MVEKNDFPGVSCSVSPLFSLPLIALDALIAMLKARSVRPEIYFNGIDEMKCLDLTLDGVRTRCQSCSTCLNWSS